MSAWLYPSATLAWLIISFISFCLLEQCPCVDKILLMLVVVGSTYDSLIISIGRFLKENPYLQLLNRLRFLLHSLFVPCLIVVATGIACTIGPRGSAASHAYAWGWAIATGLVILDLLLNFRDLQLKPITYAGTVRYVAQQKTIPVPAVATTLIVGVVGLFLWFRIHWPWLLVGSVCVFVGNAIPAHRVGPVLGIVVELLFLGSVLLTEWTFA